MCIRSAVSSLSLGEPIVHTRGSSTAGILDYGKKTKKKKDFEPPFSL